MIRSCIIKQLCLAVMGGSLIIMCISGCGAKPAAEDTGEIITSEENIAIQQGGEDSAESETTASNDEEQGRLSEEVSSEETIPEETVSEELPTQEELYRQQVLAEEFGNSRYDLTAALTEPALKELCSSYFTLGVGLNGSSLENQTLNVPEYMAVVRKHFNSCTMTNLMKSGYILDQQGSQRSVKDGDGSPVLSFDTIDPTLEWCQANGMQMRGHTLVWHVQAPDWFFRKDYSDKGEYVDRETMLFRMESYIAQLMTHVQDNYPGVVYCWDVVNEAVDPDKGASDSFFPAVPKIMALLTRGIPLSERIMWRWHSPMPANMLRRM